MKEISLDELESYYKERISEIYSKQRAFLAKFLDKIDKLMVEVRYALKRIEDHKNEIEMDEKTEKFFNRFYSKVKDSIETVKIPEELTADNVLDLINKIKKMFGVIHEAGRKTIPHIGEKFKDDLKYLDAMTRKLGDVIVKTEKFIRKRYRDVHEAEKLVGRIPRLKILVERVINAKKSLENIKGKKESLENELKELEENLLRLEAHPLFKEKSDLEKRLVKLRMEIDDKLKFKKALKRLRKKLESGAGFKGMDAATVKKYISDPINTIVKDGPEHPRLTDFLVKLRYILEQNPEMLQIKADTKNKTLINIDKIVSEGILKEPITEYISIKKRLDEIEAELEKKKLDEKLDEIKRTISIKTQNLEHLTGDLTRLSGEYRSLLEKIKNEREELGQKIREFTGDEIKINIELRY